MHIERERDSTVYVCTVVQHYALSSYALTCALLSCLPNEVKARQLDKNTQNKHIFLVGLPSGIARQHLNDDARQTAARRVIRYVISYYSIL